jgi:hypothetical protein
MSLTRLTQSNVGSGIAAAAGIAKGAPVVGCTIASALWSSSWSDVKPPPTKTRLPLSATSIAKTSSSASGSHGSRTPVFRVTAARWLRSWLSTRPKEPPKYTLLP